MHKHDLLAQLSQAQMRIAELEGQLAEQRVLRKSNTGAPALNSEKLCVLIEMNAEHYGEMDRILDALDG